MKGEYFNLDGLPTRQTTGLIIYVPYNSKKFRFCKECQELKTHDEFTINYIESSMMGEVARCTICKQCKEKMLEIHTRILQGETDLIIIHDDPYFAR